MKRNRITSIIAIVCLLTTSAINVSATCIEHGPYNRTCSGNLAESRAMSHTYDYQGYLKKCNFYYNLYNTIVSCATPGCSYSHMNETHSHGYSGHDGLCGWINGNTCYLR